ncbi:MAG TPA: ATP-binding protein [Stellaceae bacterium]|nr:ATP-binding protein [Stellaceae bacterium]
MPLPRLFRTSSFRLTVLYAALFSASVIVLFAVIYWSTSFYMTGQLDAAIDSDFAELHQGFRIGGATRVASLIEDRVKDMPSGPMFYLLENPAGGILAGNLPKLPHRTGTFDTVDPRAPHRDDRPPLRARAAILPGGDYLMVATGASQRDEMGELILRAFGWGSLVSLLLAFGGGLMLSSGLLRRVEAISRTAREIMEGHLSRRVPTRGTDDEFDHLAASLNAMLERTESSMHAMRQISNDIAHDLRTPLTRLRQRLELAQRKGTTVTELRAAIAASISETDAILASFGALLRIAQIESRAVRAGFADCDLSELLRTVVEVYQPTADEKNQTLSADVAGDLTTFGDRELLAQMLANLMENALRHSPEGAAIRLVARGGDDGLTIILSDTGPGIPVAEYENVFRRFYRLEASRTTPGNGLGLSLVSAVAALHGISVAFADNNPGLRVTLSLRCRIR